MLVQTRPISHQRPSTLRHPLRLHLRQPPTTTTFFLPPIISFPNPPQPTPMPLFVFSHLPHPHQRPTFLHAPLRLPPSSTFPPLATTTPHSPRARVSLPRPCRRRPPPWREKGARALAARSPPRLESVSRFSRLVRGDLVVVWRRFESCLSLFFPDFLDAVGGGGFGLGVGFVA